ncbi:thermonuclease family protein [Bordetella sp. FB-8]|uniref:thermonuclease family protein n=1 Tax=Bordetella sp. FB-8 TaxID=1159870 RepID=UPI0003767F44|nr:thermonuclease family protein [Bordetella sp. FB-8]
MNDENSSGGPLRGNSRRRNARFAVSVLIMALAAALLQLLSPTTGGLGALHTSAPDSPVPAGAYELAGKVINVADGDTVTLLTDDNTQHRIRLDSIDAPEKAHGSDQPGQLFAEQARRNLAAMVAGKRLRARCYETDRYKREVCALMLDDGSSVNRAQVQSGYAWAYTARHDAYLRDGAMPELQSQAKQAGLGLWAQQGPTAPWKWRYDCWRQQRCD